jgi:transcriptional regulator with XRE-family HTH domain
MVRITIPQIRGARGLLGWSQADLASKARLSILTVNNFENSAGAPKAATVDAITKALMDAGIVFLSTGGVELRPKAERFITIGAAGRCAGDHKRGAEARW